MDKHIGLKEKLYASLAEAVYEEVSTEDNPSFIKEFDGEFEPFVDNDKWCNYHISCKVDEETEKDDYDVTRYYHIDITELEVVARIFRGGNIETRQLNIDLKQANEIINEFFYDQGEDITVEYWEALEDAAYKDWDEYE